MENKSNKKQTTRKFKSSIKVIIPKKYGATIYKDAVSIRTHNGRVSIVKKDFGFNLHFERILSTQEMLKGAKNNLQMSSVDCDISRGKMTTTVHISPESLASLLQAVAIFADNIEPLDE